MKGYGQYLADTMLIEKLATMEIGLSKTAGITDLLGGLGDKIKSEVSSVAQDKGLVSTLEEYLATGVILKLLGPWGWVISTAASFLGFDIGSFIGKIIEFVKNKIANGQDISLDDINSTGKSLAESASSFAANDGLTSHSSDMLIFLKKADANESIMKLAAGYFEAANEATPFLGGKGGIIGRIFGNLFSQGAHGKSKILMIIAGLIVWVIKTVLLGAGAVKASSMIKNYVDKNKSHSENETETTKSENTEVHYNIPLAIPNSFKSSGDGNQYHINDGTSMWIVPLLNKDIKKTLLWWTITIYPELKGYENELSSASSFTNMVSLLSKGIDPNHPDYVKIPIGLHTRKEIVDRFAGEVKLKDMK